MCFRFCALRQARHFRLNSSAYTQMVRHTAYCTQLTGYGRPSGLEISNYHGHGSWHVRISLMRPPDLFTCLASCTSSIKRRGRSASYSHTPSDLLLP